MSDESKRRNKKTKSSKNVSKNTEKKDEATTSFNYRESVGFSKSRQYLTRYKIRPSTAVTYSLKGSRPMRPVTAARIVSRDPKKILTDDARYNNFYQRIDDEEYIHLDQNSKKLASYVKSITTQDTKQRHVRNDYRIKRTRDWYATTVGNNIKISDMDIVLRDDLIPVDTHRRMFREPRTNWMRKLEAIAYENEKKAKKSLLVKEEEVGDICCCPMFTTHLFFPKNYFAQKYYKLRTTEHQIEKK